MALRLPRGLFVFAICFALTAAVQAQQFALHDGDRVVFYGDSITEQRLYTSDVELYVRTRFPGLRVTFTTSGVGGDTVRGGWAGPIDERLRRDVLAYDPTMLTIMLGMNDGGYRPDDAARYDAFVQGYRHIVQAVRAALPALRLTLIEPSPFDDVTRPPQFAGGYNGVLRHYGQFVAQLAGEQHFFLADCNAPVVADLRRARALDADAARLILPDRVHPGPVGHWWMAEAILRAWHAPALVAAVSIDAAAAQVRQAENTSVTELRRTPSGFTWTQADRALPLPFDTGNSELAWTLRASDIVAALDQEPLRVSRLPPGDYELTIDGRPVGSFSSAALAAGINLATLATPMVAQARGVGWAIGEHNDAREEHLRAAVRAANSPDLGAGLRLLDTLDQTAEQDALQAAQPRPHHFALTRR